MDTYASANQPNWASIEPSTLARRIRDQIADIERTAFGAAMTKSLAPVPFSGFKVIINDMMDDRPRMTVSACFAELMPPEFVADLNAWMRDRFGVEHRYVLLHGDTIVCGPKGYQRAKDAMGGL